MTTYVPDIDTAEPAPQVRRSPARKVLTNPLGLASLIVILLITALGLLAPILSSHDPNFASLKEVNAPVGTPGYLLGADGSGRDILARVLASINVSMISAVIGAGVAVILGTVFGLISGYVGKRTDAATSWVFNLMMTFPSLVLVIILFPVTGGSYQITIAIFGLFLAPGIFRLVRNLVVGVRNELYVDAARVAGLPARRILSRHIFYVIRGPIIIATAFMAGAAINVQAGLAFLGLGSNRVPSFGAMTADAFLNIYAQPLQILWPSLFLALLTGSFVLLGNAYRDALATGGVNKVRRRRLQPAPTDPDHTPSLTQRDSEPSLLHVSNLRVGYPQADGRVKPVVQGISFDVAPGEVVGLVGESGSGKTQTAFAVLGLLPSDAQIQADAMVLADESLVGPGAKSIRRLRGGVVSYIPQEPMSNLDPSFTVGSQLVEGLTAGGSRQEAKATVLELLARVGIPDPARTFRSYPHQISGGMAQRVLIAGAIASRPKLLIADEPTTALDVTVQAEILDLLRDLQAEYGMAILLVTHNFGVVADLCDRVMVMSSGRIVETGDVRAIFHAPQDPYTRSLLNAILDEDTPRIRATTADHPKETQS